MPYRVLLTDGLGEEGKLILEAGANVDDRHGITGEELIAIIQNYDGLIVRGRTRVNENVLGAGQKLKIIGRMGVGVDNIDLTAAQKRGVVVVNSPTATSIAVAELTLALMLDLVRLTPRADASMKAGEWAKRELRGTELFGKTLGIVGVGNIGGAVAERADGFGMTVIGTDIVKSSSQLREFGVLAVSLEELYKRSDFISLHVPLTEETRGMIGDTTFSKMKSGVRIICAARGGVIDESALLRALDSGSVAGAGLDVFETEPPGPSLLVTHPRVVATPHIGGQTEEGQMHAAQDIADEVLRGLQGKPLRWRIV